VTQRIRLLPEAEADIAEACDWYDEASSELGDRFLDAALETISLIAKYPEGFALVHEDVRRALMRSFPYGLFYFLDADAIVIFGCFHARRDPRVWQIRRRDE